MSPMRPSLRSFFALLLLAAFALNWLWEMVQMPAYAEMAGRTWGESAPTCTAAAAGDVVITLAIYAVAALAAGSLRWPLENRWNVYAAATLLGAAWATAVEWRALAFGRWSYADQMPVVPTLGVGLWPFLQLTLLVPAALWMASRWPLRRPGAGGGGRGV